MIDSGKKVNVPSQNRKSKRGIQRCTPLIEKKYHFQFARVVEGNKIEISIPKSFNPQQESLLELFISILNSQKSVENGFKLQLSYYELSNALKLESISATKMVFLYAPDQNISNGALSYTLYIIASSLNKIIANFFGVSPFFQSFGSIKIDKNNSDETGDPYVRLDLHTFARGVQLKERMGVLSNIFFPTLKFSITTESHNEKASTGILVFKPEKSEVAYGFFAILHSSDHIVLLYFIDSPPKSLSLEEKQKAIDMLYRFLDAQSLVPKR